MSRRRDDDEIDGMLARMQKQREITRNVLDQRIGQPMPGHTVPIQIDLLDPDPNQPRKQFPTVSLAELAESIRSQGVLQPLIIRPKEDGRYWIVAGERRFRASRMAGLTTLPCVVRNLNPQDALVIALAENVHRDDLTDMEKSDALVQLYEMTRRTWDDVAKLVHLSEARVKQLVQLQRLAEPVKELVRLGANNGGLSGKKALPLLNIEDLSTQIQLAEQAAAENWTQARIQDQVRAYQGRVAKRPRGSKLTPGKAVSGSESSESNNRLAGYTIAVNETIGAQPAQRVGEADSEVGPRLPGLLRELAAQLDQSARLLEDMGGLSDPEQRAYLHTRLQRVMQLLEPIS